MTQQSDRKADSQPPSLGGSADSSTDTGPSSELPDPTSQPFRPRVVSPSEVGGQPGGGDGLLGSDYTGFYDSFFEDADRKIVERHRRQRMTRFAISIKTAPILPEAGFRYGCARNLFGAFFELGKRGVIRRGNLEVSVDSDLIAKVENASSGVESSSSDGELSGRPWITMTYKEPGKEFHCLASDDSIAIVSPKLRLDSVVWLASDVFGPVLDSMGQGQLSTALRLHDRATSVHYSFDSRYILGEDKIDVGRPKRNYELIEEAIGLSSIRGSEPSPAVKAAFSELGTEDYVRLDFNYHAIKTLSGSKYNSKIKLEAPFNEENTLLFVGSELSCEEEFGFQLHRALDVRTAMVDFYRDVILSRFLANLFCKIDYQSDE